MATLIIVFIALTALAGCATQPVAPQPDEYIMRTDAVGLPKACHRPSGRCFRVAPADRQDYIDGICKGDQA